MAQPTPYEPTTDFSQQEAANASGRSTVNTAALDAELANIQVTLDQTLTNLAIIQRDDGQLSDESVEVATLSRDVLSLIGGYTNRGNWATATAYAINDLVSVSGYLYQCITAHTSAALFATDAAKWKIFGFGPADNSIALAAQAAIAAHLADTADAHDASAISYAGSSGISATDVEAAIDELDTEKAPLASPTFTGDVVVPTQTGTDNSTKAANMAAVQAAISYAVGVASIPPPVRQTVLSGPVDSSGYSAFGGSTGSTTVTASGTLKVTAAAGGDANYTGSITNPSWTGLSTNGTMFLYLDVTSAGVVTTGSTTLNRVEQWGGTYSTTNNQHTFNIQEMTMKVGNGSAASQVYRVFVGEVTVAGGVVTAITWYALMGRYDSGLFAVTTSTAYAKNHNIGTQNLEHILNWADDAAGLNERPGITMSTTASFGAYVSASSRNSITYTTSGSSPLITTSFGVQASGYYRYKIKRSW